MNDRLQQGQHRRGDQQARTRALIFDSHYDAFKGVIAYVKVVDGELKSGDRIKLMSTGKETEILELGYFSPEMTTVPALRTGEVGYIATGMKVVKDLQVGDTVTVALLRDGKTVQTKVTLEAVQ